MARLEPGELLQRLARRPGLIPIHIDLERQLLLWCDLGEHQLSEAFFGTFVAGIAREADDRRLCVTGLDALTLDYGFLDVAPPAGFVFHMGRCGSTLLSRALARSRRHVVLSEAQPHNTIWWSWTENWLKEAEPTPEHLKAYRNLLLLMGRRRCPEQQVSFVKFSSWNVLLARFIKQAFPGVPGLFLYRDPAEVMVSCLRSHPGWLTTRGSAFAAFATAASTEATAAMTELQFCEKFLARLLSSALAAPSGDLAYLNYRHLTPDSLGSIIERAFDHAVPPEQLTLMREQFGRYAKDEGNSTEFVPDTETKRQAVTPAIRDSVERALARPYEELEGSERNLMRGGPPASRAPR